MMATSDDSSLEMVLKEFHSAGEIVWYHDDELLRSTIFPHWESLINVLRAVFRHDYEGEVHFAHETGHVAYLEEGQFDKMKNDFFKKRFLTKELLRYLLVHFHLSDKDPESLSSLIRSLMLKFDLSFELEGSITKSLIGSTNIMQFPWFFTQEEPEELAVKWNPCLPQNVFELRMEFPFCPPNFFEKLSIKLHTFLSDTGRLDWKDGVFVQKNTSSLLVRRRVIDTESVIVVAARGSHDLQELWGLIKDVRASALTLLDDWPLLKDGIMLVCTHCLLKRVEDPHRYHGMVFDEKTLHTDLLKDCCKKFPDDNVPLCLVFPMRKTDDQDYLQKHMQAARDFMRGLSTDVVDGGERSLLSDSGLAVIASNLGINWNSVALQLGVPHVRIEKIKMNHQHNVNQQIIHALIEWRDSALKTKDYRAMVEDLFGVLASKGIDQNELVEMLKDTYRIS